MRKLLLILAVLSVFTGLLSQSPAEMQRRHAAVKAVAERAAQGDSEALYQLSTLHERGYDTIPQDTLQAILLLRQSAEGGYAPAQNILGYKLIIGEGVAKDAEEGLKWIENAAEAGEPKALSNIGYLLLHGEGVPRDEEKAAYWLERAADEGINSARSMLGDLYRDGTGVTQDSIKAKSLYRLAFDNGLTDAGYKLYDITKSEVDSMPAAGRICEGLYYFNRTTPSIGVKIFRQLADTLQIGEKGMTPELKSMAKALMGDACSRGRGIEYDYNLSMEYYLEAARRGNPSAEFIVGEILEIFPDALNEFLRPDDPIEFTSAAYWLDQASAAGVRDATEANHRLHNFP